MDNLYLNFRVRHQNITRMDFIKVVSGSQNYVKAKFNFSDDWAGLTKTARFTCNEESFDLILEQDECMIPWEVIKESGFFDVSVFGGSLITVDVARVYVTESGYAEGGSPLPPTPSVYEQIIDKLNEIEAEFSIEGIQKTVDEFLATKDFITEEDVEVIVERILATKDYATKNDISDLATKDDIKDFITEEQVTPIAEEVFEAHKSEFVGAQNSAYVSRSLLPTYYFDVDENGTSYDEKAYMDKKISEIPNGKSFILLLIHISNVTRCIVWI